MSFFKKNANCNIVIFFLKRKRDLNNFQTRIVMLQCCLQHSSQTYLNILNSLVILQISFKVFIGKQSNVATPFAAPSPNLRGVVTLLFSALGLRARRAPPDFTSALKTPPLISAHRLFLHYDSLESLKISCYTLWTVLVITRGCSANEWSYIT